MSLIPNFYELFDPFFDAPLVRKPVPRQVKKQSRNNDKGNKVEAWRPPVDIKESDNNLILEVELPGLKKTDINLEFNNEDRSLTISGESKKHKSQENETTYRRERYYGSFQRIFVLPENCDQNSISAKMEHGVLFVSIPKVERKQESKKINIE
eukprot:gb/GECH01010984.1/.p1 GENE.gb/GECH01010984.1/~~gb/GECH01010984.1/.p1  ORF type:complete len:153 (+),score=47.27 gb/GECH01010984.1/:1-459(+)